MLAVIRDELPALAAYGSLKGLSSSCIYANPRKGAINGLTTGQGVVRGVSAALCGPAAGEVEEIRDGATDEANTDLDG